MADKKPTARATEAITASIAFVAVTGCALLLPVLANLGQVAEQLIQLTGQVAWQLQLATQ